MPVGGLRKGVVKFGSVESLREEGIVEGAVEVDTFEANRDEVGGGIKERGSGSSMLVSLSYDSIGSCSQVWTFL